MALTMHGFRAAVVLLLSLLAANAVLWLLLTHNKEAGIYPPDADSLSLPFISTALFSLLIYGVIPLKYAAYANRASIRVENINGPVLMISGVDDKVWPSTGLTEFAVERLKRLGFR